jgi:nicotinamide-nucleotide amidase
MKHTVGPYLQGKLGRQEVLVTRILRTVAIGESQIDRLIADLEASSNPTVGLSAHAGQTDVRIVAKAPSLAEAEALVADYENRVRERLGATIYATGDATVEAVIAGLLEERGATLAVAETLTQGDIARRLGSHPNAFAGSIVAAQAGPLMELLRLGVPSSDPETDAVTLAGGVRLAWHATHGLAVVGDEEDRAWVAVSDGLRTDTRRLRFQGRDFRARVWTTTLTLEFVRRLLLDLADGWAE